MVSQQVSGVVRRDVKSFVRTAYQPKLVASTLIRLENNSMAGST
jgi:hypothetical protein